MRLLRLLYCSFGKPGFIRRNDAQVSLLTLPEVHMDIEKLKQKTQKLREAIEDLEKSDQLLKNFELR